MEQLALWVQVALVQRTGRGHWYHSYQRSYNQQGMQLQWAKGLSLSVPAVGRCTFDPIP